MTVETPECPDCDVPMESMRLQTSDGYTNRFVSDENRDGLLGKIGVKQSYDAEAFVCPDCGLSRLYADLGDESDDGSGSDADADGQREESGMGSIFGSEGDDRPDPAVEDDEDDQRGWSFE